MTHNNVIFFCAFLILFIYSTLTAQNYYSKQKWQYRHAVKLFLLRCSNRPPLAPKHELQAEQRKSNVVTLFWAILYIKLNIFSESDDTVDKISVYV
jgi:hypothetical protein